MQFIRNTDFIKFSMNVSRNKNANYGFQGDPAVLLY